MYVRTQPGPGCILNLLAQERYMVKIPLMSTDYTQTFHRVRITLDTLQLLTYLSLLSRRKDRNASHLRCDERNDFGKGTNLPECRSQIAFPTWFLRSPISELETSAQKSYNRLIGQPRKPTKCRHHNHLLLLISVRVFLKFEQQIY